MKTHTHTHTHTHLLVQNTKVPMSGYQIQLIETTEYISHLEVLMEEFPTYRHVVSFKPIETVSSARNMLV